MTPLRDKAIAAAARDLCPREDVCAYCLQSAEMAVDALLAAGMLTDPEECARTYSLISELIATGKDDDAERAYRLAVKAWRRARDVADGKPLPPRDDEARIERAALAALDGILIALGWALDDVEYPKALNAARAALAAADQQEKP